MSPSNARTLVSYLCILAGVTTCRKLSVLISVDTSFESSQFATVHGLSQVCDGICNRSTPPLPAIRI